MTVEIDRNWISGFLIGPLATISVALILSWKAAWIGMVCDLIIGFFLILIALGYDKPNMAKGTAWGFLVAVIISIHPLWLTFGQRRLEQIHLSRWVVTTRKELEARRLGEAARIRLSMNAMRAGVREKIKGGPGTVAFVKEEMCIGCDQCTIVCDDDAIELYDTPLASPILDIEVNRKAKVLRDPCTGCRLCVLACPTDAIIMIDRQEMKA